MTSNYNHLYVHNRYPIDVEDTFTVPIFYEHEWRIRRFGGLKVMSVHYEYGWKVLTFDHWEWRNSNSNANLTLEEYNNRKKANNVFKF